MDTTAAVDPLALMRRVGRLYRLLHATVQPRLEDALDLQPKEVQVLGAVAAGHTSPGRISARVGTPPPSTSRLIDGLVDGGLLERQADPDDLRRFVMRLTPRGVTALAAARTVARDALGVLLQGVPAEDLQGADRALARLETPLGLREDA